jgi:VanZ family protein
MRYRGSLVVWALLLAYASLYPVIPLRPPSGELVAAFFARPRYITGFDIALNVLAYVPLGTLACLQFLQRGNAKGASIMKAALLGAAFSFAMECAQLFIPTRIASIYDVMANGAGALAGALVFADPWYSVATRPLGRLRDRLVIEGEWGDAGLVLAMLWIIAQHNPALPFFGAGNIVTGDDDSSAATILQWLGVSFSICGFGLFISALLRGPQGALRVTVVLLSIALWLKFVAASFMLQPHFAEDWLSVGRIIGLVAGIAMLFPLRLLPRGVRMYLAILFVLAGALFSKIFGAYSALDELLKLFRWPYGQLATFTTLTQFLHEAWPFLALVFLIALFLHTRKIGA